MSWIRDHFFRFVFPALFAAEKETSQLGEPVDFRASPFAPQNLPPELRKLWTVCRDLGLPWHEDVREVGGGTSSFRTTAQVHQRILRATLDSAVAAMKAEGCDRLFFAGRDVWMLAVLAERRSVPYLFIPEVSRPVADSPSLPALLESRGFTGRELWVDTGFAGSIPRAVSHLYGGRKFPFRLMSQSNNSYFAKGQKARPQQLFPNRKKARDEALESEYLAKYWKRGHILGGRKDQLGPFTDLELASAPVIFKQYATSSTSTVQSSTSSSSSATTQLYKFTHSSGYLGLSDMAKSFLVSAGDAGAVPGFNTWWGSLPVKPDDLPTEFYGPPRPERIMQHFNDQESIRRAAILTSKLWRGL